MYHRLGYHFGHTRWYSYVTWVKWKLVSVQLETMLILTQDWYTVLRRTCNRLRNQFGVHLMELLGNMGQVEAHFGLC
jgi:hypothetical protein